MSELTLMMGASLKLKASKDGAATKVTGIAYSGGIVEDYGVVIDLDTVKAKTPMPILHLHRDDKYIGVLNDIFINKNVKVSGELFSDIDPDAKDIAEKARRGSPYELSLGLSNVSEEFIGEGGTIEVNGKTFSGPVFVIRDCTIREVSIVPLGADHKTSAKLFSKRGGEAMPKDKAPGGAKTINELKNENEELQTKLSAALQSISDLEAKYRRENVSELLKDVGIEDTDEAAAPYMGISDKEFSAISKQMRAAFSSSGKKVLSASSADDDLSASADGGGKESALVANMKARFKH